MYLTENRLSRNKTWCAADNHNYVCHICTKEFLDKIELNLHLLTKYQIFTTYSQKSQF